MHLDELAEGSKLKDAFMERKKYSDLKKEKSLAERKPEHNLICQRCHELKN